MPPKSLTRLRKANVPARETPLSRRLRAILEKWVPIGLQYFEEWPQRPNCGHFFGGCHWYGSDTAGPLFAFAALASSPEYDAARTGCSKKELKEIALKGIRYLCFTHDSGPADCIRPKKSLGNRRTWGTKWGEKGRGFFPESQCGPNMADIAIAALLLGNIVDDETWTMIARMHADYAYRFGTMAPKSGVYTNTQMEENGWTSTGLASVECVLSNSSKANTWAETARRWMFSTATAQQDTKNHLALSDGRTVREYTGQTFTTLPDYMAENHGMVHPSYTASSLNFTGRLGIVYATYGAEAPEHAYFNRQKIYDQLKLTTDRTGSLHPIQGMDWPYLSPDPGTLTHAAAAVMLKDADGAYLERLALETMEARVDGTGGRMHDQDIAEIVHGPQDPLLIRESGIARPAHTYLFHRLLGDGPRPSTRAQVEKKLRGVKVFPHSGFAFQRHARGQTSFSWRNSIMALPLNKDGIYTVAPATDSFLAQISVKNQPDSQDLVSIRVDEQSDCFAAGLVMDRAQRTVRQEVLFAALPSGVSVSCERLQALKNITVSSVNQGFLRIINENFPSLRGNCSGRRTLYTPTGAHPFDGAVSTDPNDDVIQHFNQPGWVNIDNRLGILFSGSGKTVYHNRRYYDVWRAVADDVTLSRIDRPFRLKTGGEISTLTALISPDCNHAAMDGLSLFSLNCPGSSVGLLAGDHLAVANFGAKSRKITFSTARSRLASVPIFEGTTTCSRTRVGYHRVLGAGECQLRSALLNISCRGTLEITASESGRVLARNCGRNQTTVGVDGRDDSVRIEPGEIKALA
jgi:hypothetical protein